MNTPFSNEFQKVLSYAEEEALRTGYLSVKPEHLMLGILRHGSNEQCRAMKALGADLTALRAKIEDNLDSKETLSYARREEVEFSEEAKHVLSLAVQDAALNNESEAGCGNLLSAFLAAPGGTIRDILLSEGVARKQMSRMVQTISVLKGMYSGSGELTELRSVEDKAEIVN